MWGGHKFAEAGWHSFIPKERETRTVLATISLSIAALIVAFGSTYAELVDVWVRGETFAHCFAIAPLSVYLVWRKRLELGRVPMRPWLPGLALIFLVSLAWMLADLTGIAIGTHLAAVALLPIVIVTCIGKSAAKIIAFPLAYLGFMIPVGEAFIPALMNMTAVATAETLRFSGFPVFRDGNFFYLPSGAFEVARACSGIRYLIASVALGALFAYLTYTSQRKRLVFMLAAIAVPIIANILRAYGIVLIATLSEMQHAVGVDHIIYGWLFFGVVISILFGAGARFADQSSADRGSSAAALARGGSAWLTGRRAAAYDIKTASSLVGATLIAGMAGPALAAYATSSTGSEHLAIELPSVPGWTGPGAARSGWAPRFVGASSERRGVYTKEDAEVEVYVAFYGRQTQGSEVVNSENQIHSGRTWSDEPKAFRGQDGDEIIEARIGLPGQERLIWAWYVIGDKPTSSEIRAKLLQVRGMLSGRQQAAFIAASVGGDPDSNSARVELGEFLTAGRSPLTHCVAEPQTCATR